MATFNLPVGQSVLLKASVLDQNNNQLVFSPSQLHEAAAPASVNWSSNHTNFATVSNGPGMNRGLVTGIAPGTATITATYTDNLGNTATLTISVVVYAPVATTIQAIYPGSSSAG